jgi:predicted transcriptional regulator of viral defense system
VSDSRDPRPPRPRKHRPGTKAFDAALLARIKAEPGLTIPVLADAMECAQNQLYRVLPRLHKEGVVVRVGRGWHLRDEEAAA